MLWKSSQLKRYSIRATDGLIGGIDDFLFDDSDWTVRWAVVDTGTWLPGRSVLLPASVLRRPDSERAEFPVELSKERIQNSPGPERDAPVSRQMETEIYAYYGWAPYWATGYGYAGATLVPPAGPTAGAAAPIAAGAPRRGQTAMPGEPKGDPHLRSANEITGYFIRARDGEIGHIEELLIEDDSWTVRYVVVDTRNWWPGRMVLISPEWIKDISWSEQRVFVDVSREDVERSPEYAPESKVEREYEARLFGHYGLKPYWI